jgi:signal transduction histidine kinase
MATKPQHEHSSRIVELESELAAAKREIEIEAALEKVRSASLAMIKGEELKKVVAVVFEKLKELGLTFDVSGIQLYTEGSKDIVQWVAAPDLLAEPILANLPYVEKDFKEIQILKDFWMAKEIGKSLFNKNYSFNEKNKFFEYAGRHNDFVQLPPDVRSLQLKALGYTQTLVVEKHSALWVDSYSGQNITSEGFDILKRFARVFEQAYVRFFDLQKAEALAREAQIEVSLERVRSRAMAMQRSEELGSLISTVYGELTNLDVIFDRCFIMLFDPSGGVTWWMASPEAPEIQRGFKLPLHQHKPHMAYLQGWKERKEKWEFVAEGEEKREWDNFIFSETELSNLPETVKNYMKSVQRICLSASFNTFGCLTTGSNEPLTEDAFNILIRFTKVFETCYTRFNDLKQAEAQAWEAQIEAALERVRSRAMVMQTSQELKDVAHELRKQIGILGLKDLDTCVIHLYEESPDLVHSWAAIQPPEGKYDIQEFQETVPKKGLMIIEEALEAYKSDRQDYILVNEGSKIQQWLVFMKEISPDAYLKIMEAAKFLEIENLRSYWSCSDFSGGSLLMVTMTPPEETYRSILRRFANVFGMAYRRFADLKHAEAQAREALIEAALERVRSRAMAMHKSSEIPEVAHTLYGQLKQLGFEYGAATIMIIDKETGDMDWWMAGFEEGMFPQAYRISYFDHPVQKQILENWKSGKELSVIPVGTESKKLYDEELFSRNGFKVLPERVKDWMQQRESVDFTIVYMKHGALHWGPDLLSEEQESILKRFAKVFEQTYTRFLDLKNAEEQAKEATKQASLDRVRAEIASMRSASDLDLITPLIFNELTILGVPFIRCGVFVIYEMDETVEAYLSSPDGKSLGVLRLSYHSNELTSQTVDAWRKGLVYRQHWDKADFVQWIELMMEQDQIQDKKTYQGEAAPPEKLDLHFVPFSHGMLYVGSTHSLNDTEIDLVKGLAKAFSIAYARYEDFVRLEKAKESIETALMELKSTQAQLIHAEKMASLGELTAGIAHEIQNPLNFVNNFSEVSVELVEEIRDSRLKTKDTRPKTEEDEIEDEILEDIKQNLEKIKHHGKRADAIVKGMLEHSRTSSGEKVPTDINALADEYLRLSYHGMRAKDKSFNADFVSHFDPNLPKVNVVPQDIGRVLLNIINNAFQAVGTGHALSLQPTVTVSTKNLGNKIQISIKDNGPGIPDSIKDKIFQPFFTTKPTGQGTGLGLSLSYDIVKVHGGELSVETEEDIGSCFSIILPKS